MKHNYFCNDFAKVINVLAVKLVSKKTSEYECVADLCRICYAVVKLKVLFCNKI